MDAIKYIEGNVWAYSINGEAIGIIHPASLTIHPKDKFYVLNETTQEVVAEDVCLVNMNGFIEGHELSTMHGRKFYDNALIEGEVIYIPTAIGVGSVVQVLLFGEVKEAIVKNFVDNEHVQVLVDKMDYTRNRINEIHVETTDEFYYVYEDNYTKLLLCIYKNLQPRVLSLTKFESELLKQVKTLLNI